MQEGFIKLGRSFFEHFLWSERREFSKAEAWLDCVQLATFRPYKTLVNGELIEVPRGGFVASERYLSDRWMWSRTKIRAFLDLLTKDGMISREKTSLNTIVLLCNFDKFNQEKYQQKTGQGPPEDHRGTKEEEGKEEKDSHSRVRGLSKTPPIERVISEGARTGIPAEVCEKFFFDCDKRPLAPSGNWIDRGGNEIAKWPSALISYWRSWESNAADRAHRGNGSTPAPKPTKDLPPPPSASDYDALGNRIKK